MSYATYQAALFLANRGTPVLPTSGKAPVTPNGFKDATTDPHQIREWFEHTDFNVATVPADSGWFVVDVDLGADPELVKKLPPTSMVRTPSGGFHYYYLDSELDADFGNTKLAPRMDIRHARGYVLVPPSPGYVHVSSGDPVPVPGWVIERLRAPHEAATGNGSAVTPGELIDTLALIDPGCDYNEWARVLAAIAGTELTAGDKASIAFRWSIGEFGNFEYPENAIDDYFDMNEKLATFKHDGKVAGFGTLRYLAGLVSPPCTNAIPDDINPNRFTVEAWCERADIAEREQLIGPISKTSRVMLVAPTGLGKTHVAMAIAFAIASGDAWLPHWDVPEASRVLYIDGEMPATLMRDRIAEARERCGPTEQRLHFLNYADFLSELGGFPPMESTEGQVFIDSWLNQTGAKFAVFDNVQSLTIGDMKETDSWRQVQAFCRKLTDQGIGQLWVHHANANGSMYGDKTRAYQFDTVISLKAVENAVEGELTFDLGYQKTRELHPEKTASRYQTGRVSLSKASGWKFVGSTEIEAREVMAALSSGEMFTSSELAEAMGITKRAVNQNIASGKWAGFVVPGSHPRRLRHPTAYPKF